MRELKLMVPAEFDGAEAQTFLKSRGFSRRALIRLKQTGGLTRGGALLRTVDEIHCGEELCVRLSDDAESAEPNPELNAPVIYEDEDVAVFDKPPHMPVHPSIRHRGDTLANLFAALRALRVRKESIRCLGALRVAFQGVFRSYLRHSAGGYRGRSDRQSRGQHNHAVRHSGGSACDHAF